MTKNVVRGILLVVAACGSGSACGSPEAAKAPAVDVPAQPAAPLPAETSATTPPPAAPPPADAKREEPKPEASSSEPIDPNAPFDLAAATAGLGGAAGALVATIKTSKGDLRCRLFDDKAPVTVANFVGLARGVRAWKSPEGAWVKRPAYDGTTFHRIVKGFMIQGGDPTGTGKGEPGYTIKDELWPGAKHDKPGLLCMANRGHDTNGMQFFVTDKAAPHLDGNYTIFGECAPAATVHAIAAVPVNGERPVTDVAITTVEITRGK